MSNQLLASLCCALIIALAPAAPAHGADEAADDALLKELKEQLAAKNLAGAKATLGRLRAEQAKGTLAREIPAGLNAADRKEWKEFERDNPIRTVHAAEAAVAAYLVTAGKAGDARVTLEKLVKAVPQTRFKEEPCAAVIAAKDVRSETLLTAYRAARAVKDPSWSKQLRKRILIEYGAVEREYTTKDFKGPLARILCAEEGDPPAKKLPMFTVTSDTTTIYLLGSIHLAREDIYPLDPKIEEAFARSKYLVVEVNVSGAAEIVLGIQMASKGTYRGNDRLSKHITKDVEQLLKAYLKQRGRPMARAQRFKPWMLAMTLSVEEMHRLGLKEDMGIDKYFLKKAAGKKKILELETADDQLRILYTLPDRLQNVILKSTLVEMDGMAEGIEETFNAWETGDMEAFAKLNMESLRKYPELEPLIDAMQPLRNVKMAAKIEGFLKTKEVYFVVVGAGHLAGEDGIPDLLSAKYRVTQIEPTPQPKEPELQPVP